MAISGVDGKNSYWPASGSSGVDGGGFEGDSSSASAGGDVDASTWSSFGGDLSLMKAGSGQASGLSLGQTDGSVLSAASDGASGSYTRKRDGSPTATPGGDIVSAVKEGVHYAHKVADKIVDTVKEGAGDVAGRLEEDAGTVADRIEEGTTAATNAATEVASEGSPMLETAERGLAGVGGVLGGAEVSEGFVENKKTMERISKEGMTTDNALDLAQNYGKIVGGSVATLGSLAKLATGAAGELESAVSEVSSFLPGGMRILGAVNVVEQTRETVTAAEADNAPDAVDHGFNALGSAVMTRGGGYGLVAGLGLIGLGKLDKYAIKGADKAIADAGPDAAAEADALGRYSGM